MALRLITRAHCAFALLRARAATHRLHLAHCITLRALPALHATSASLTAAPLRRERRLRYAASAEKSSKAADWLIGGDRLKAGAAASNEAAKRNCLRPAAAVATPCRLKPKNKSYQRNASAANGAGA